MRRFSMLLPLLVVLLVSLVVDGRGNLHGGLLSSGQDGFDCENAPL